MSFRLMISLGLVSIVFGHVNAQLVDTTKAGIFRLGGGLDAYYALNLKDMKSNKYSKDEIISALVQFENNPINNNIFMRRQSMWYYIDKLKNDKFMKKYVLW